MSERLKDKKVAILVAEGFEESEFFSPLDALEKEGATVEVVSLAYGKIRGWKKDQWGAPIQVHTTVERAMADDYDALVVPGGVMSPDRLRRSAEAVEFVRGFFRDNKPVAAICHGPQVLIDAGVVRERRLTSFESIKADLKNAGAMWQDTEVVVDKGLVTSRTPEDLPAFNAKLVEAVEKGPQEPMGAMPW